MRIYLDETINSIINLIKRENYKAYLVGGFVRDSLLNKESYDVDITTNAPPYKLKEIFKNYKLQENFMDFGSIKFEIDKYHIEITTFRKEYNYINHRKPNKIEFVSNLKEDLHRRDFTINALCYDDELIDLFKGIEDLNYKVIKTIGNPYDKFQEDALRILRALRFSSKLGFDIEKKTKMAIKEKYKLLKEISFVTIQKELKGILEGENFIKVLKEYKDELIEVFSLNDLKEELFSLEMSCEEKEALFFYYSDVIIKNKYLLKKECEFKYDKIDLKKKLSKLGKEVVYDTLYFKSKILKINKEEFDLLEEIINNGECFNLKNLDVNGEDLLKINIEKNKIGKYLESLLTAVIENKCINDKKMLIEYLKNNIID